jgi:hypothetical protein
MKKEVRCLWNWIQQFGFSYVYNKKGSRIVAFIMDETYDLDWYSILLILGCY